MGLQLKNNYILLEFNTNKQTNTSTTPKTLNATFLIVFLGISSNLFNFQKTNSRRNFCSLQTSFYRECHVSNWESEFQHTLHSTTPSQESRVLLNWVSATSASAPLSEHCLHEVQQPVCFGALVVCCQLAAVIRNT